jgi:hypothetical protein
LEFSGSVQEKMESLSEALESLDLSSIQDLISQAEACERNAGLSCPMEMRADFVQALLNLGKVCEVMGTKPLAGVDSEMISRALDQEAKRLVRIQHPTSTGHKRFLLLLFLIVVSLCFDFRRRR